MGGGLLVSDYRSILGMAAGVLGVLAMLPYIATILTGATRPSRTSWLIWTVVSVLLLTSYRSAGATDTIWLAVAYFLIPLTIFGLSLRQTDGAPSVLDWCCLAGACSGLAVWIVFRSAAAALYVCIAVDALGALPTLRKAYADPNSENLAGWAMAFGAASLNLAAIRTWTPQISAYPLYAFALAGSISSLLVVRRRSVTRLLVGMG